MGDRQQECSVASLPGESGGGSHLIASSTDLDDQVPQSVLLCMYSDILCASQSTIPEPPASEPFLLAGN